MKRRRLQVVCTLLCVCLLCGVMQGMGSAWAAEKGRPSQALADAELQRAAAAGWVPETLQGKYDETIRWNECCRLIAEMIRCYRPEKAAEWEKLAAKGLAEKREMRRDDGMLAVYEAACLLGKGGELHEEWLAVNELCGEKVWDEWRPAEDIFANCKDPAPFEDQPGRVPGWPYLECAYHYSLGACSKISGNPLFDCDVKNETMHPAEPLLRGDTIRAVLRLSESMPEVYASAVTKIETDWEAPLLKDAAERRETILNSETEIVKDKTLRQGETYTGTAYYVSNSGNDKNDGKSPKTAWATLEKVNSVAFKKGDAVFFERGGVWYAENGSDIQRGILFCRNYVTYSAYGEGPKPVLNGSKMDMADPARWTKAGETADGGMVWQFKWPVHNTSGMIFDEGKQWGRVRMPDWDGKRFINAAGEPWTVKKDLTQDLDFFVDLELKKASEPLVDGLSSLLSGKLYLRCDEGNPGEVFEKIEIIQDMCAVQCGEGLPGMTGEGIVVDNLSLKNCNLGVACGLNGAMDVSGVIVQNCEISYCGGTVQSYQLGHEGEEKENTQRYRPSMSGGAVLISGCNHTARNNYIHDVDNKVFVLVINTEEWMPTGNLTMEGNLVDHCASALRICNYREEDFPEFQLKNICFQDNQVLYTGYGWYTTKLYEANVLSQLSSIETEHYLNRNDGTIFVKDNFFYLPHNGIFNSYAMWGANQPKFSGNTVVQRAGGGLIDAGPASEKTLRFVQDQKSTQAALQKVLGDKALRLYLAE